MQLSIRPETAPLTAQQMAVGQRWVIRCSVISMLFWAGLNDRVVSLFMLRLNPAISDVTLAFFFAIGPTMAILTAVVSPLVEFHGKKRLLVPFYLAGSVFLLCPPLLPFVAKGWGPAAAVIAGGVVLTCFASLRSVGFSGWFPIIDDNVPSESRGRFFGKLRMSWQLMLVLCTWGMGAFLGHEPSLLRFQIVFLIAFAANVAMAIGIMAVPEAPLVVRKERTSLWRMLGVPFRDPPFVSFVVFSAVYSVALAMPGPFAVRCMKNTLGAGDNLVVWMDTLASIGAAAMLPIWGRFVDRYGSRAIFVLLLPPLALVNLLWLMASPSMAHWPVLIGAYAVLQGMCLFGIGVGVTDMMLDSAREGHRSAYINIAFVASTVAAGVGPFVGAAIARALGGFEGHWGVFFIDGNRWVFLVRVGLLLMPLLLVNRLSREHGGHVGESLQQLSADLLNRLPFLRSRAE